MDKLTVGPTTDGALFVQQEDLLPLAAVQCSYI